MSVHVHKPIRITIPTKSQASVEYRSEVGSVCECGAVFNKNVNYSTRGTKQFWKTVKANRLRKKLEKKGLI